MKKRIFLQIIIVLLFLLVGNLLIIGKQYQANLTASKLDDAPILIYSRLYDDLVNLQIQLEQLDYVDYVDIQPDSLIVDELIEVYKLESAFEILQNYKLPSAGQIYIKGTKFNKSNYQQLQNIIFENYRGISINYNEEILDTLEVQLALLDKIFYIMVGIIAFLAIIILTFLRVHFENKHNNYWSVFTKAGGDPYKREKLFWADSVTLSLIPAILIGAGYWGLRYKELLNYEIELLYFGIEFGVLIFITLLARIILGKKI